MWPRVSLRESRRTVLDGGNGAPELVTWEGEAEAAVRLQALRASAPRLDQRRVWARIAGDLEAYPQRRRRTGPLGRVTPLVFPLNRVNHAGRWFASAAAAVGLAVGLALSLPGGAPSASPLSTRVDNLARMVSATTGDGVLDASERDRLRSALEELAAALPTQAADVGRDAEMVAMVTALETAIDQLRSVEGSGATQVADLLAAFTVLLDQLQGETRPANAPGSDGADGDDPGSPGTQASPFRSVTASADPAVFDLQGALSSTQLLADGAETVLGAALDSLLAYQSSTIEGALDVDTTDIDEPDSAVVGTTDASDPMEGVSDGSALGDVVEDQPIDAETSEPAPLDESSSASDDGQPEAPDTGESSAPAVPDGDTLEPPAVPDDGGALVPALPDLPLEPPTLPEGEVADGGEIPDLAPGLP